MSNVTGYLTDPTDDALFPIRVNVTFDLDPEQNELVLDSTEAQQYIDLLDQLITELDERDNPKVRVRFYESGLLYTYRDPSGELEVGDRVLVPTRQRPENVATVEEMGDGGYEGVVSNVTAKLERVEL